VLYVKNIRAYYSILQWLTDQDGTAVENLAALDEADEST
jgi:hypothetical protein